MTFFAEPDEPEQNEACPACPLLLSRPVPLFLSRWEGELHTATATAEELKLAHQLIDAACGPLDWARYRDTTAEELAALVEAKVANRPSVAPAAEPAAMLQLIDALK